MTRIPPPRNPAPQPKNPRQKSSKSGSPVPTSSGALSPDEDLTTKKPPMHLAPIPGLAKAYDDFPVNGSTAPSITDLIKQEQSKIGNPSPQDGKTGGGGGAVPRGGSRTRAARGAALARRGRGEPGATPDEALFGDLTLTGTRQVPPTPPSTTSLPMKSAPENVVEFSVDSVPTSLIPPPLLPQPGSIAGGMMGATALASSSMDPAPYRAPSMGSFQNNSPSNNNNHPTPAPGGIAIPFHHTSNNNNTNNMVNSSSSSSNAVNIAGGMSRYISASPNGGTFSPVLAPSGSAGSAGGNNNNNSYAGASSSFSSAGAMRQSPPNAANGGSGGANESGITVAVRVRPFNRKEVGELLAEQQRRKQNPSLSASARLAGTVGRIKERQPFGPGHTEDYAGTVNGGGGGGGGANSNLMVTSNGEVVANPLENCDMDMLMDDNNSPLPVMEVKSDCRTLVLLDPHQSSDRSTEFTYDYVFSSFAPSIEIQGLMNGSYNNRPQWGDTFNEAGMSPLMSSPPPPPLVCGLEVDLTPEQDQQAEAEQVSIFQCLGLPIVSSVLEGFNACIFAYGQTSSGKTYTMMGTKQHRGLIPRLCHELFRRVEEIRQAGGTVTIEVSYMEIYNDQVRDLLKQRPKNAILHYNSRFDKKDVDYQEYQTLRVRNNPQRGMFVEGLTTSTVKSWEDCGKVLKQGNALRTQCATSMNETSSRSHAVFQLVVTQVENMGGRVRGKAVSNERISKVNLVDLAGSERNSKSESTGKRLAEANSINTSLSTLRHVIEAIVTKKKVIPYRESLLTYVLSDNLGGNSRTVMCANVSPHAVNYAETDSTLRYATIAKDIRNKAKINENPNARIIRELKDRLQDAVAHSAAHEEQLHILQHTLQEKAQREEDLKRQLEERDTALKNLQKQQQKKGDSELWKKEAERQRKEAERQRKQKDKLRTAFRVLANAHPELVRNVLMEESQGGNLISSTNSANAYSLNGLGIDDEESLGTGGAGSGPGGLHPSSSAKPRSMHAGEAPIVESSSSSSSSKKRSDDREQRHHPKHLQALQSLQNYRGIGAPLSLTALYSEGGGRVSSGEEEDGSAAAAAAHRRRPLKPGACRSTTNDLAPPPAHGSPLPTPREGESSPNPAGGEDSKRGRRGRAPSSSSSHLTKPAPPTTGSSGTSSACYHTEAFLGAIQAIDQGPPTHHHTSSSSSSSHRRPPLPLPQLEERSGDHVAASNAEPQAFEREPESMKVRHQHHRRRSSGGAGAGALPSRSSLVPTSKDAPTTSALDFSAFPQPHARKRSTSGSTNPSPRPPQPPQASASSASHLSSSPQLLQQQGRSKPSTESEPSPVSWETREMEERRYAERRTKSLSGRGAGGDHQHQHQQHSPQRGGDRPPLVPPPMTGGGAELHHHSIPTEVLV